MGLFRRMKLARTVDISKAIDLRNRLNGYTGMVNNIFSASGNYAAGNEAAEMFVGDLLDFALYIIKADGTVSKDEVEMLNVLFGAKISKRHITSILENRSDIDWTLFANSLPESIVLIARGEKEAAKQMDLIGDPMSITANLISLYVDLGVLLTVADGDVDDGEVEDYKTYIRRLLEFLNDERDEVLASRGN